MQLQLSSRYYKICRSRARNFSSGSSYIRFQHVIPHPYHLYHLICELFEHPPYQSLGPDQYHAEKASARI